MQHLLLTNISLSQALTYEDLASTFVFPVMGQISIKIQLI